MHKGPSFLENNRLTYSSAGLGEMELAENCVSWRNKPVAHSKSRSIRNRKNIKRTIFPNWGSDHIAAKSAIHPINFLGVFQR
jgi:hypothetical protein